MKITYLGTAAAEGWPAIFCNCEYCKKAKSLGGKNIRTRSQALINDDLLIDFPTDTLTHAQKNKLDLSTVKFCFVTHSHLDHFQPLDILCRIGNGYSHGMTEETLRFYGNEFVRRRFEHFMEIEEENYPPQATMTEIKAYQVIEVGGYKITPLPAYHVDRETPFVYLIEKDGQAILYLHDTGMLFDEVFEYLEKNKIRADLISYDCTYVALPSGGGHLGLDSVPTLRKKLEKIGVSDEKTISVVNHFSHNGMLLHDELVEAAGKINCLASYDGMVVEF
jgi:phosphoribosyl 1,2-cyclic phosphate phosphodiesterase